MKEPFGRPRVPLFSMKFLSSLSPIDQAQHALWKTTAISSEQNLDWAFTSNFDEASSISSSFDFQSHEDRNRVNRLVDIKT